jgi:hypothetical protein
VVFFSLIAHVIELILYKFMTGHNACVTGWPLHAVVCRLDTDVLRVGHYML